MPTHTALGAHPSKLFTGEWPTPRAPVVSVLAGLFSLFCKLVLFMTSFGFQCLNSAWVKATPKIRRKIWCQPQWWAYVKFCFQKHFYLCVGRHVCSCWTVVCPGRSSWEQSLRIRFSLGKVLWRPALVGFLPPPLPPPLQEWDKTHTQRCRLFHENRFVTISLTHGLPESGI